MSIKPEFSHRQYLYAKVSLKPICLGVGRVEQEWDKHAFQYHVRANFNKYKLFGDNTNSVFNVFQEPKCQVIWNVKKNKNFVLYLVKNVFWSKGQTNVNFVLIFKSQLYYEIVFARQDNCYWNVFCRNEIFSPKFSEPTHFFLRFYLN